MIYLVPLKLFTYGSTVNWTLSLISFNLACEKTRGNDRIDGKYIFWAIYLHIRGEGEEYLESVKSENNSYFTISE